MLAVPFLRDAIVHEHFRKSCDRGWDRPSIAFQPPNRHGNVGLRPGIAERFPHRGGGEAKSISDRPEFCAGHMSVDKPLGSAMPRRANRLYPAKLGARVSNSKQNPRAAGFRALWLPGLKGLCADPLGPGGSRTATPNRGRSPRSQGSALNESLAAG